jgi:phosphoribosylanthranilate isomerase
MIIKVCGLKDVTNIQEVSQSNIDWIGYNFYPPSPRYVSTFDPRMASINQKKVGVFVNEDIADILSKAALYNLDYVQLHGDESVEICKMIHRSLPVIKVFRVGSDFDYGTLKAFDHVCDYFLFDTWTKSFGGSGEKFDWSDFKNLELSKPFIVSGGIGPGDIEALKNIDHPMFAGIDINSKFELQVGCKDITLINQFVNALNA